MLSVFHATLHQSAIEMAEQAAVLERASGRQPSCIALFKEAYSLEIQAAIMVDESEIVTRTIYYSSAMHLAASANLKIEAREAAEKLLSFTTFTEYQRDAHRFILEINQTHLPNSRPERQFFIGQLTASAKSEVMDGQLMDTMISVSQAGCLCHITGSDREKFIHDLCALINRYSI